jgi:MFS family permease
MLFSRYFQLNKFSEFNPQVLRHNLIMHMYDGSLFIFATSFINYTTVLPVFIQRIGGNAIAIGSVTVLWTLGLNLPQLFFVRLFHHQKKIKPSVLRTGLLYRLSFVIISLVCSVFLGKLSVSIAVPLMLLLVFLTSIAGSTSGPPWFHFFSKTTPIKLRGRLLAIRWLIGSGLGTLGGLAVSVVLSSIAYPHNFALLFFICFFFTMVSLYFLSRVEESSELKEPEEPGTEINPISFREVLSRSKMILKQNKDFKNFLVVDALILMSLTASAFYAVYAIRKFNLPTSYAGTFTIILMASQVLGNILFGFLADFFGHKINILLLAVSSAAASIIAVLSNNVLMYGIVFFFMGFTISLQGISRLAITVEMCNESERPIYLGLLNSVTAPTILFGVIGGSLITIVGYIPVFFIYIIISTTAFYWMYKKVNEPRKLKIVGGAG